jgi:hypothetical protein
VFASAGFEIIGLFGDFRARRRINPKGAGAPEIEIQDGRIRPGALIEVNAPYPACALLNGCKARRG